MDRQARSVFTVLKLLGAVLLLGGWSLALAGPAAKEPTVFHSAPDRARSARAPILNVALPALAAPMPRQSLPLDEPRPSGATPRDLTSAAGKDRSAREHPPGVLAIHWRESREIVNADIVGLVRNYRRDGLPLVHLYQSNQNMLAIGLNNHGIPGIYFTRHVGG